MKKIVNLILVALIGLLFAGCGAISVHGISKAEIDKHPLIMTANEDIRCGLYDIKKGVLFGAENASKLKYNLIGKGTSVYQFPNNTIFLRISSLSGVDSGFMVYPNGEFVFDNYNVFMMDKDNTFLAIDNLCNYKSKKPLSVYKRGN